MRTAFVDGIAAVPAEWDPIFAAAHVQSGRAWFMATERAALPADAVATYLLCRLHGRPAAIVPFMRRGASLGSLTTPYTTAYAPLIDPALDGTAVGRIGYAVGRACRAYGTVRLEALDPHWPGFESFRLGLQRASMTPHVYQHFGNWFEPLTDWATYLAARPGSLRETIRRKSLAAARDPAIRIECIRTLDALGPGIEAFEAVYARSWKEPEPYPAFNRALLPLLMAEGQLRLGIMWLDDRPIAVQYWTVHHGIGTVLKLAHDEIAKTRSAGTVLTAWMIKRLIEDDGTRALDFGRGDDDYKRLWASERRQRMGLLLTNPRRLSGLMAAARHRVGLLRATMMSLFA